LLLARGILLDSASHASLIFFFRCWLKKKVCRAVVMSCRCSVPSPSSLFGDFWRCPLRLYLFHVSSIFAVSTKFAILLCLLCHASPLYLHHRQLVSSALVFYGFSYLFLVRRYCLCRRTTLHRPSRLLHAVVTAFRRLRLCRLATLRQLSRSLHAVVTAFRRLRLCRLATLRRLSRPLHSVMTAFRRLRLRRLAALCRLSRLLHAVLPAFRQLRLRRPAALHRLSRLVSISSSIDCGLTLHVTNLSCQCKKKTLNRALIPC
jgi:hypothetical protein